MLMTSKSCPLCQSTSTLFCDKPKHLFYKCTNCEGIFRPTHTFLTAEAEKAHYEKHNNDVFDERYQAFVLPIVDAILQDFSNLLNNNPTAILPNSFLSPK